MHFESDLLAIEGHMPESCLALDDYTMCISIHKEVVDLRRTDIKLVNRYQLGPIVVQLWELAVTAKEFLGGRRNVRE